MFDIAGIFLKHTNFKTHFIRIHIAYTFIIIDIQYINYIYLYLYFQVVYLRLKVTDQIYHIFYKHLGFQNSLVSTIYNFRNKPHNF